MRAGSLPCMPRLKIPRAFLIGQRLRFAGDAARPRPERVFPDTCEPDSPGLIGARQLYKPHPSPQVLKHSSGTTIQLSVINFKLFHKRDTLKLEMDTFKILAAAVVALASTVVAAPATTPSP